VTERISTAPILFVDVDGVISLFGFPSGGPPPGQFHWVDGIAHCISDGAGKRLRRLASDFELVWATGWEEKANFYLPDLLGISELPVISFDGAARFGSAHWKLGPLDEFAQGRALAWIDDNFNEGCYEWAEEREEPTLLVPTEPHLGIEEAHVEALRSWALSLD